MLPRLNERSFMYKLRLYNVNKFKLVQYMHLSVLRYRSEQDFVKRFKNPPLMLYRYINNDSEVIGYMVDDTVFELFGSVSKTRPELMGGNGLPLGGPLSEPDESGVSILDNSNKLVSQTEIR